MRKKIIILIMGIFLLGCEQDIESRITRKEALKIARDIINNKEDINKRLDVYQSTALITAVNANSKKALKLLIKNGADANIVSDGNVKLMDFAKMYENKEMIQLIKKYSTN